MEPQSYFASGFVYGVVVGVAGTVIVWLWVRLALASGAIARRRGYPRFAGFAAGLLTGPIALVILAVLPSRNVDETRRRRHVEGEQPTKEKIGTP
jgi:hypothetical protein